MLLTMCYNVWIILAVLLGHAVAYAAVAGLARRGTLSRFATLTTSVVGAAGGQQKTLVELSPHDGPEGAARSGGPAAAIAAARYHPAHHHEDSAAAGAIGAAYKQAIVAGRSGGQCGPSCSCDCGAV